MPPGRIGLIGGLSWESTASYYASFHELLGARAAPWTQPRLLIDSLNFAEVVEMQQRGAWDETGELLADSARRLVRGGASVIGIGANTMHVNFDAVESAVDVPVVDVRVAVAREARRHGGSLALLATKYVIDGDFYAAPLEAAGLEVVRPDPDQVLELQRVIFDELTRGIVTSSGRESVRAVARDCVARGASAVGLCCTEFGLLISEDDQEFAVVDSTRAHVRALLEAVALEG